MHESSKALRRRFADGAFHTRFLVGRGIDIGSGEDPLTACLGAFRGLTEVRPWDRTDGDAQFMAGIPDASFDFVHSSHCLEHLADPVVALEHWLRILKPGGHLIVTVPDEDLYEQGQWPSRFNADHRWSFTIFKPQSDLPRSVNLVDLVRHFGHRIECERLTLLRDFHRADMSGMDQTAGPAECAIEMVWRKKPDPSAELLQIGEEALRRYQDGPARAAFNQAVQANPLRFDARARLAHVLTSAGDLDAVEALWAQAVRLQPQAHLPRLYQALFVMSRGRLTEGLCLRDPLVPDARRTPLAPPASYPRWQGELLRGRSIVIWTEFGFGDELMFSRFASVFKRQLGAARVSLVCQAPLLPVMRSLLDADAVISDAEVAEHGLPAHDFWVFPHSIGVHLPLDAQNIPAPIPYLQPPPERLPSWETRLPKRSSGRALRVGLVWRGNPTHENDAARSLAGLYLLEPLLAVKGVDFVSLQKGEAEAEVDDYRHRRLSLTALGQSLGDFGDTAAVLAGLDLLITVDTSVAHLAGAMGLPTWVLVPAVADWRWFLGREDSPWYPDVRLFRQQRLGQWAGEIQQLARALEQRVAQR